MASDTPTSDTLTAPDAPTPSRWRIGCARIPDFAMVLACRAHPHVDPRQPIVLIEEKGNQSQVAALNTMARVEGLRVGLTASRARARFEHLVCLPWDPDALTQAARHLADQLETVAPLVVPVDDAPGVFWIDARGMRWLGGEDALADRVLSHARALGFGTTRLAVADTAAAARAAVHLVDDVALRLIPPGGDRAFLARLPLTALNIDADMRAALESVGIHTAGALATLPASALEDRFGPAGRAALERALGVDLRRIDGRPPPALPEAALGLEHPVSTTAPLLFGLRSLLDRVASQLIDRGVSATRVDLRFTLDGAPEQIEILLPARPVHHPRALFELCRDRLEGLQVDAPVIELTVAICAAQPAVPEQTHLGASRWDARALEGALNRLHGRFGQSVVFTAAGRDDPRPEAAGRWVPVDEVPLDLRLPDGLRRPAAPAPIRRQEPTPIPLTARLDAHGIPIAVQRGATWRPVSACGPERLSGGWWDTTPYAREDWRLICLDAEGGVLWASRSPDGRWWLRGHWD